MSCADVVIPGTAGREACRPSVLSSDTPQLAAPGQVQGLVLCAITGREAPDVRSVADLLGLGGLVVSAAELAEAAGNYRPSGWDSHVGESPNPRLLITPGSLVWTRKSVRQLSREAELALRRHRVAVDAAATMLAANPDWQPKPAQSAKITAWSAKSRANMYRTLASLDYAPLYELGRVPAMVTLTYPADWQTVAPDGQTVKAQLKTFRKRYERAWREPLIAFWKLEFQARGAPHIHLFMAPPHGLSAGRGIAGLDFRSWLSLTWAKVVGHPDAVEFAKHLSAGTAVDFREGTKAKDPRRLAVYFGKHGTYRGKEYQHDVPPEWSSTGRWWGYWHLKPLVVAVEMTSADYGLAKRIARHHADRHKVGGEWVKPVATVEVWRRRIDYQTGEVRYRKRKVKRRVRRLTGRGGFLMVNNGPAIAAELARAVKVCGVRRE